MSNHLWNIAAHELDLFNFVPPPHEANNNNSLLQYHSPPPEQEQAFLCRSQSIKLRNTNRNHRTRRNGGGRSSLAYQRRPSMCSTPMKKSSFSSKNGTTTTTTTTTTMEEKEAEIRDGHDTLHCEVDRSVVSYNPRTRQERRVLLRALAFSENNDNVKEEAKKEDAKQDTGNSNLDDDDDVTGSDQCRSKSRRESNGKNRPVARRTRSMDPGLLRGRRRGGEDQGEDQPSPKGGNLRRSQSLDHAGLSQKTTTAPKKKSTRRKRHKAVPKISSISSVDTIMMEGDIWIECLWFTKNKSTKRSTSRKKTYFKSFRTQQCLKRPPYGARTVLYLETFSDSDEDCYSSRTRSTSFGRPEEVDVDEDHSDCGDSMECLYHESCHDPHTSTIMKQECNPMMVVPEEIMKFTSNKKTIVSPKKPRRVRKRGWRGLIQFFVKTNRASF